VKENEDLLIINNFEIIRKKINDYYEKNNSLPQSLDLLSDLPAKYDYVVQDSTNFKLCATFNEDITQEVLNKAAIRVNYKKGYDCIIFNISGSAQEQVNTTILKKGVKLTALQNTIKEDPAEGVVAGSTNIKFDTLNSTFYTNDSEDKYFLDLYATISTSKECNSSESPENGCCYTLDAIVLNHALTNSELTTSFNKLGAPDYIDPLSIGSLRNFEDIPVNYCFNGNQEISGGISFSIPKKMINLDDTASNKFYFQHTTNGETSNKLEISIQ